MAEITKSYMFTRMKCECVEPGIYDAHITMIVIGAQEYTNPDTGEPFHLLFVNYTLDESGKVGVDIINMIPERLNRIKCIGVSCGLVQPFTIDDIVALHDVPVRLQLVHDNKNANEMFVRRYLPPIK